MKHSIFRIQLLLTFVCLTSIANAQILPDSALSFEAKQWWTDSDVRNIDKGDLSSILNQFDMYHNGFLKETSLQKRYNNYYVGNGQLGMFVDALGAQTLPYLIDSTSLCYTAEDRDAIDLTIGTHKSTELQSDFYRFGPNQLPTINYNESWVKSRWVEHGNDYGRGHLSIRNSIFPTIDNVFEANNSTITNYKQRMNLWDNTVITEFTYKQQLQVQITSYTHWANNRVAVFRYKIKNISKKQINAGGVVEPIVSYRGQRLNFSKDRKGLSLHLKEDWLLHELSVYLRVSGIRTYTVKETGKIYINSSLNPGDSSSFTVYQGIVTSKNTSNPVLANTKEVDRLAKTNYDKVFKNHRDSVHEFWNRSYVLLPWKDLCKLYYRSALIIAGNLRYGDYYPGVSMLTSGSYTGFGWGMDSVPVYDFLMQSGRADYVLNVFKHFRNTMPADPENFGNQLNYSFGPNPWGTMVCNSSGNY